MVVVYIGALVTPVHAGCLWYTLQSILVNSALVNSASVNSYIEWVSIGRAGCEQMPAAAAQVGVKIFIAF